ncbi:MAG TPA: type III secretion inner membrane ring lipoprotein SctJ [Noviherbaspirillum sp.]|nr:type III secretion inner membrane ring lipoprotein SctJ [Noviherbaspirillum sp.]
MSANLLDYQHSHAASLTASQWQRVQTMLLRLCVFCLFLFLCGCSETTNLQAGLNDADANEIVSVLNRHGITAQKRTTKEGVTLTVKMSDISRATEVMHAAGLPRRTRTNLGQVFKKEGMISTPLEERVRYIHGLSEELEFTLQQFDNVVSARVHVVLPERIAPGEPIQPSSAAVFVKYRPPFDEDTAIPRIRNLVASSIPGLSGESGHDKVSVVLAPSEATAPRVEWTQVGPFIVQAESAGGLIATLLLMAGVVAASLFYAFIAGGRRQVLGNWARKHFGKSPAFNAGDEG